MGLKIPRFGLNSFQHRASLVRKKKKTFFTGKKKQADTSFVKIPRVTVKNGFAVWSFRVAVFFFRES